MSQKNNLRSAKSRLRLAIFSFTIPVTLFAFSLIMLVLINLFLNPTFWMTGDTQPVNPTPVVITVSNIVFLITGAIGLISLLPGAVAGIVLLTRSKYRKNSK